MEQYSEPIMRTCVTFPNKLVLHGEELLAPSPNPTPKIGGTPFVGCPRLTYLIYFQLSYRPGSRLLHPQPDDAACYSDKGPT